MFVALLAVLMAVALAGLAPAAFLFGHGYYKFKTLEASVTSKMDKYYLAVTAPERAEYLLSDDEVFEVPYMASTLSAAPEPSRIYDSTGRLIGEFAKDRELYAGDPAQLPDWLKKALVATEDRTFYSHHGVNYLAMAKALADDVFSTRRTPGRSTLTQQLAKLLFTTRQRTWSRKVFELFCAKKLESKFTKDQILLMYLDFAYFGHGCFGIEAASRLYFNKPAASLELGEAAMLVGILPSPNKYSPFIDPDLAQARHRTVLRRMAQAGFIPAAAVERYSREFWQSMAGRMRLPQTSFWRMSVNEAPYFIEHVRRQLEDEYTKERVLKGGLRVYTTLDLGAQRAAEGALLDGLRAETEHFKLTHPSATASVEGAFAAVDPASGGILAMVGGSGYSFRNQLDRASGGRRPIGSSVKPFVYAVAFEKGTFTPEDKLTDERVRYRQGPGRTWSPRNYGNKYYGEVTLRLAVARSLNTVAVQVLAALDIDDVIALLSGASGAAASNFQRDLTLALGTCSLTPVELAAAYSIFVNDGRPVRPHSIVKVEDRDGKVLREHAPAAEPPLLSTATCHAMLDVLQGVFQAEGTAYAVAKRDGFSMPAAGKTGTTDDYRDAWMAGVTPDISAVVRIGNDDMRLSLGDGRSGGSVAAPVWVRFMKEVYRHRPTRPFPGF
ncbi:MAG: PBP1A family penicillin-binding protein [Elusimicrobiota bacterium]